MPRARADVECVQHSWTPSLSTEKSAAAEATRGRIACVHAVLGGLKLADAGVTTEPRRVTEKQSRPADLYTIASVPGRSAAPDVCVVSSNAAAARGDAAQVTYERKTSHYRRKIPDLRAQGIVYRLQVWTADGRPHPAVTRTMQHAADIASGRNGQHSSAKAVQHRWKQGNTNCPPATKGSQDASSLPNTSAREQLPLADLIDRATNHWIPTPPLDGGEDEDTDIGTDTTVPDDDNDDSASLTCQHGYQTFDRYTRAPSGADSPVNGPACGGTRGRHLRISTASRRLGARLVRHSDCAVCPRRPPGYGGRRHHLCQTARYSRTMVPSHVTPTSGSLCRAASQRTSRCSSTSRRTSRSPRILPLSGAWLRTGNLSTPTVLQQRSPPHRQGEETVTAALTFVADRLAAAHIDSCPFSLISINSHDRGQPHGNGPLTLLVSRVMVPLADPAQEPLNVTRNQTPGIFRAC